MLKICCVTALAGGLALAQTQIDLRTQAKRVDFTGADSTRPVKTGTALPPNCAVGDMFFKTDAPLGSNLYGCAATNTWVTQSGTQNLTFKSDGATVGARSTLNLVHGQGLLTVVSDTGTQINFQAAIDPAVVQTQTGDQAGTTLLCASRGASGSQYTCSLAPAATQYSTGMVLHWVPDVDGADGPITLDVDGLGPKAIAAADGVNQPAKGDITGGRLYAIWYDGAKFRLLQNAGGLVPGGTVTTVFGRTGAVTAQSGDYTTDQVNEGSKLYFTDVRALAAVPNFTGDSGTGGVRGTVPAPAAGDAAANRFLKADGTWAATPASANAVTSVFGRTGAVTAQSGDYTTDQVNEGSKLYFTDVRALAAVPNFTGDSGTGGVRGTVPAPAAGDAAANKFLKADGRWAAAPAVAATTCIDTAGLGWFAPLGANPGTAMALSPNMGSANGGGFYQFVVPCTMTVSKALFNVTTAQGAVCDTGGASPCGFVIAIYNSSGNLVGQTTSIYSGGTPDLSTTGAKAATFTAPVTLAPGVYWMSLTGDGTALRLAGDTNSYGLILNADSTTRIGFGGGASTGHGPSMTAAGTKPSLAAKSDSFSQLPSIYLVR